jgi:uncharacterized protein with FMN-binding domain
MSTVPSGRKSNAVQILKKLSLSTLVVITFIAYAVREQLTNSQSIVTVTPSVTPTQENRKQPSRSIVPTATARQNLPPPTRSSIYQDGNYTGDVADAFYGNVQVMAVIQGGQITDVQFLDYPHDRRVSMFINSQAMPYLTTEAIQAQSAQVDIISGATLTSEAFIQSLQSALNDARNQL